MSIHAFSSLYTQGKFDPPTIDIGVLDCVVPGHSDVLQDLTALKGYPLYAMPRQSLARLRKRTLLTGSASPYPKLLQGTTVPAARRWISGRYHGVIAAFCANLPVVTVPSNTFKIEGLLADAGLSAACMLPQNWANMPLSDLALIIEEKFANWGEAESAAQILYIQRANEQITKMFDEVAALAHG
jgi:hypothetical protein